MLDIVRKNLIVVSTKNGQEFASIIQKEFEEISYTVLINQIEGKLLQNELQRLTEELSNFDYAILVIHSNDLQSISDISFLLGLLIGNLSLTRIAILSPINSKLDKFSSYLKYIEPEYYDDTHPNDTSAISQGLHKIIKVWDSVEKRKNGHDYEILENKKELLRIALGSCGENKERFDSFLGYFDKCFNAVYKSHKCRVLGTTLFLARNNFIEQISQSGIIKRNHKFSLDEKDKGVVECYNNPDKLLLTEKKGRYLEDEDVYEYIFYKCIHKKFVLTVHIKYKSKIRNDEYQDYLETLRDNNKGYIGILQLFLKGGKQCCEYQKDVLE